MKTVILDYGHGVNCPGKCSPDLTYYEWQFARRLGAEVKALLLARGFDVRETWTQDHEPLSDPKRVCTTKELNAALNYRWRKVNEICREVGTLDCISVSLHTNAAGSDGRWHDARGFVVTVSPNASALSKRLARCVYEAAEAAGLRGNRCVPAEKYWVQNLAMCRYTACPAILVESLFHDNREDVAILNSVQGLHTIATAIADGITKHLRA